MSMAPPDQSAARTAGFDTITFASMTHKNHYNHSHQSLFFKVGKYALLRFQKSYSIPSTLGVNKKLTQQYVKPFRVLEKVRRLPYCLDVPLN